jgi:type IV secretion system protein VirD4
MEIFSTLPPLVIIRGKQLHICDTGEIHSWLTPEAIRGANAFVIRDPDGSLHKQYAGTLFHGYGFSTKVLNIENVKMSTRYNPFAYIRDDKGVLKLVNAIMTGTKGLGKPGDITFLSAETMLFTAFASLVHHDVPDDERNINTLIQALNFMETDKFAKDYDHKDAVDVLFDEKEAENPNSFYIRQYRNFEEMTGEDGKDIILSYLTRLDPLKTPEMQDFLSTDGIN